MAKINVQLRVPEHLMKALEELAPRSKSEFIRDAIEEKLKAERSKLLEKRWISALKNNPDADAGDDGWMSAEEWDDK